MANRNWAGTTFGNGWMHRELIRMLKYVDVRIIYIFMAIFIIPGCMIFAPGSRIIYSYFRNIHHRSILSSLAATYRNLYLFGQVVVDRFAFYAGKRFQIQIDGYEAFSTLISRPQGFLQLSAHIGNYEMAGYNLVVQGKKFYALVFGGEKQSIMANRNKVFGTTNIDMIAIRPDMSHLFQINNALADGNVVSMPADRNIGSQKTVEVNFMGRAARLPYGPFSVATARSLDVIAVNVMKTSTLQYTIYVKSLPYDKTATRTQQIQQLATAYKSELERMLTMYPEQWYNYFPFWN